MITNEEIEKKQQWAKKMEFYSDTAIQKYDDAIEWLKDSPFNKFMVLGSAIVMLEVPIDMDNNGELKDGIMIMTMKKNDYYCEVYTEPLGEKIEVNTFETLEEFQDYCYNFDLQARILMQIYNYKIAFENSKLKFKQEEYSFKRIEEEFNQAYRVLVKKYEVED